MGKSACRGQENDTSGKIYTVSALDKVFPKEGPKILQSSYTIFRNETFHFQVSFYFEQITNAKIFVESDLAEHISVRSVESIPARFAEYEKIHDDYIIQGHGNNDLFPELLRPLYKTHETMRQNSWTTFWITVDGSKGLPVGKHEIIIGADEYAWGTTKPKGSVRKRSYMLEVLDDELPKLDDFIYTCWMHYDCICDKHNVQPYTERFYHYFGKYLSSAVKHGMNMLYTPLFTPPLDTMCGHYRKNTQLVDVFVGKDGTYKFSFEKLKKFIKFALSMGIEYFELSHLASQWGAKYAIGIIANVDGRNKRIFGWKDRVDSSDYLHFIDCFLKAFSAFIYAENLENIIFFHISDEPPLDAFDNFYLIKNCIDKYFANARVMDAVTHREFKEKGITTHPFVDFNNYKNNRSDYVYYCGAQRTEYVPNRLFIFPLQRFRVLGLLLYRNHCKGLLNWAFNFYNTTFSLEEINPYYETDAGGCFDAGDSFLVYPSKDGVLESIRHEVWGAAINDFRALRLLERYIGREKVVALLDREGIKEGFSDYPRSAEWHLNFRLKLNNYILQCKRFLSASANEPAEDVSLSKRNICYR